MERITGSLSPLAQMSGTLSTQSSMSGGLSIPEAYERELQPATTTTLGGVIVGENLAITQAGVLSVITADEVEHDNTRPITSAAVYTEVGNINALLATI